MRTSTIYIHAATAIIRSQYPFCIYKVHIVSFIVFILPAPDSCQLKLILTCPAVKNKLFYLSALLYFLYILYNIKHDT